MVDAVGGLVDGSSNVSVLDVAGEASVQAGSRGSSWPRAASSAWMRCF